MRKLTDFGAFIEIEEGIDGLVHVSDLSWTKRVKHPSEMLKKGQVVQAVILNIDAPQPPAFARRQATAAGCLGELTSDAHQVGDMVRGRICRAAAFRRVRGTGARRGRAVPQFRGPGAMPERPSRRAAAADGRRSTISRSSR